MEEAKIMTRKECVYSIRIAAVTERKCVGGSRGLGPGLGLEDEQRKGGTVDDVESIYRSGSFSSVCLQ